MRGEFVDLDGGRLYYYAAGTRGAGEPVVFLHGFPTSGHLWSDVVPLVPAGHRVVVVDLLGYGRSDRPHGHPVGIRGHADRVVALLDALGINYACLVGHDVGGGIAQTIAVRHPQRVSRLCLVNSVAFDGWPTRDVKLARAMLPLTRHLPPTWLLSVLRNDLLRGYDDQERGQHSVERYVRPFATPEGRDAFMQHLLALDPADTQAIAPRLKDVVAPVAIVWGQHDPFLPTALAERLQAAIPSATLDVIPNARHFTPEECPNRVGDAVAALLKR
ncbi:MAG TPA: alpha/beta fold hydrolase [Gemmatimonadaceae bacterium]|nr:alpha/beta fold hydrolase [Gemmatimonadaceae bacterium]